MRNISIAVFVLLLFSVSNADAADYLGFVNSYGDRTAQVIAMVDDGAVSGAGYSGENPFGPAGGSQCSIFSLSWLMPETFSLTDITPGDETVETEYGGNFMGREYTIAPVPNTDEGRLLWWTGPRDAVKPVEPEGNFGTYAKFATEILHEKGLTGLSVELEDVKQVVRCDLLNDGTDEVVFIFDSMNHDGDDYEYMQGAFSGVVLRYIDDAGKVKSEVIFLCGNDKKSRKSLDIGGVLASRGLWSWEGSDEDNPPDYAFTESYGLVGIIDLDGDGDCEFVLNYSGYEWFGFEVVNFDGKKVEKIATADWGA